LQVTEGSANPYFDEKGNAEVKAVCGLYAVPGIWQLTCFSGRKKIDTAEGFLPLFSLTRETVLSEQTLRLISRSKLYREVEEKLKLD